MSGSCVVIVASEDDAHAKSVARAIQSRHPGVRAAIVDSAACPKDARITVAPDGWSLERQGDRISSKDVRAVWNRRTSPPRIDASIRDEATRRFAAIESAHAFDFVLMSPDYPVVNRPDRQYAANRKPYQLAIAQRCGLAVPDYVITNDVEHARRLIRERRGDFVFKTLTPSPHVFGETRFLDESHDEIVGTVALAPVIFQAYVKPRREFRVTVVGPHMFVHEMIVRDRRAKRFPDWRIDCSAVAAESDLPDETQRRIAALMDAMGLCYGAIDLIEDISGTIFFLEINPAGQFLFAEIDEDTPISAAFADTLVGVRTDATRAG